MTFVEAAGGKTRLIVGGIATAGLIALFLYGPIILAAMMGWVQK